MRADLIVERSPSCEPGAYAKTDELIALAEVAAKYRGIYISHMRNEGDHEIEAIDEPITIARQASVPAEIYHFKIAGAKNWSHWPEVDNHIVDVMQLEHGIDSRSQIRLVRELNQKLERVSSVIPFLE